MNKETAEQFAATTFRAIISNFIKYPDDLELTIYWKGTALIIKPKANCNDHGKMIGVDRENYDALAAIMGLIGNRIFTEIKLARASLPDKGNFEVRTPYEQAATWDSAETKAILESIVSNFAVHTFDVTGREVEEAGKTFFHVTFCANEKFEPEIGRIAYHLSKVLHATGRARGRKIYVSASCEKG